VSAPGVLTSRPAASTPARVSFLLGLLITLLVAAIAALFFLIGLADGSITIWNAGEWTLLLLVSFGVPAAAVWLRTRGHTWLAVVLLALVAIPAVLAALALLMFVLSGASWH
jgi:hypothetical protein